MTTAYIPNRYIYILLFLCPFDPDIILVQFQRQEWQVLQIGRMNMNYI